MPICLSDYPAGHSLVLDLLVKHGGHRPAYTIVLDPSDPAGAPDLLNATGDLDFTRSTKAVGVTIYLKNKPTTHLRFDNQKHLVFSFAKDYGGTEYPITRTHYQIRNVQVTDTATGSAMQPQSQLMQVRKRGSDIRADHHDAAATRDVQRGRQRSDSEAAAGEFRDPQPEPVRS